MEPSRTRRPAHRWSAPAGCGSAGPNDPDFGHVRIGVGSHRIATKLARPETGPLEDLEPVSTVALRRFVRTHSVVHGLPTAISLRAFPAINIEGAARARAAAGAGDADGAVHVSRPRPSGGRDRLRRSGRRGAGRGRNGFRTCNIRAQRDGMGIGAHDVRVARASWRPRWRTSCSSAAGSCAIAPPTAGPHASGGRHRRRLCRWHRAARQRGRPRLGDGPRPDRAADRVWRCAAACSWWWTAARSRAHRRRRGEFADRRPGQPAPRPRPFARGLARYRIATAAQIVNLGDDTARRSGVDGAAEDSGRRADRPGQVWRPRTARERLRVPIGVTPDGTPVELDIKESAEYGMGPHGLCIGATGSGKSEFLRTLVLSMVTTHSPDLLNLVLVDFKGGATFLGLDPLPHVAAVITNLEEELSMVDRMRDALAGEMNRRQELLRAAGNFANVTEYEKARANGAPLDPLPALFVVVDEFSELLSQKPDFAELFVMIGRLGRSLRVHLLLASQRLEENRLRGLDSHLSYRIGLRTFSANESRAGARHHRRLPPAQRSPAPATSRATPRIRCGSTPPTSPGPMSPPRGVAAGRRRPDGRRPGRRRCSPRAAVAFARSAPTGARWRLPDLARADRRAETGRSGRSLLQVVVERLTGHGRPAHEVWLPPLDVSPTVDMLLPRPGLALAGQPARQAVDADRHHRQALRAAPRRAHHRSVRRTGQCRGGRRPAVRQVDHAAHAHHGRRRHPHPGAGAVLLPRFRWRHAGRPRGPAARRLGRRAAGRATGCAAPSPN